MNTSHAAPARARAAREQEAEARERQQPALERRVRGRGSASRSSVRAAAGALEHLQQRAGDARHRDVARGVAEPALGDLDERLAVVAQPLGLAVVQRGEERLRVAHVPAVEREGGEQHVAGPRGRGAQRARATPVHEAESAGGGRASGGRRRRHAEQVRRPREPVEHALGVRAVGAHEHVDERRAAGRPSRARRRRW